MLWELLRKEELIKLKTSTKTCFKASCTFDHVEPSFSKLTLIQIIAFYFKYLFL